VRHFERKIQTKDSKLDEMLLIKLWGAGLGGSRRSARGLDDEELRKVAPRESLQRKLEIMYCRMSEEDKHSETEFLHELYRSPNAETASPAEQCIHSVCSRRLHGHLVSYISW